MGLPGVVFKTSQRRLFSRAQTTLTARVADILAESVVWRADRYGDLIVEVIRRFTLIEVGVPSVTECNRDFSLAKEFS